jgi:hypothetical protein
MSLSSSRAWFYADLPSFSTFRVFREDIQIWAHLRFCAQTHPKLFFESGRETSANTGTQLYKTAKKLSVAVQVFKDWLET